MRHRPNPFPLAALAALLFGALAAQPVPSPTETPGARLSLARLLGLPLVDAEGAVVGRVRDVSVAARLLQNQPTGAAAAAGGHTEAPLVFQIETKEGATMPVASALVYFDAEQQQLQSRVSRQELAKVGEEDDVADLVAATRWARSATATETEAGDDGVTGTTAPPSLALDQPVARTLALPAASPKQGDRPPHWDGAEIVKAIQAALQADPQTQAVAGQVIVAQSGSSILLSGPVESEEQRTRVVELARTHGGDDVQDFLRISSAATAE